MDNAAVYIAGRFASRVRLRAMRERVRALGFVCASSWMAEQDGDYPVPRQRSLDGAHRDIAEIAVADLFVLDTLDESITGGREVEFGLYLSPLIDKPIVLIGPVRNIFHELAQWRCRDWSDGLEVLTDLRAKLFA